MMTGISSVSAVKNLGVQGPSYVYAILTDPRIRNWQSKPTQAVPSDGKRGNPDDECDADAEASVSGADSAAQRRAETFIITEIGRRLGVGLQKTRFKVEGCSVEIDGVSAERSVLCEAWAHQGVPKSAQKAKVMTDALKLIFALPEGMRAALVEAQRLQAQSNR
jgi:hypothetical protein